MTINNLQVGLRLQGTQIYLLSSRLAWIIWTGLYPGRKILDSYNDVPWNHVPAKGLQIKPFIGRTLECPVIEIEGVHVDERLHKSVILKKQEPAFSSRLRAHSPKLLGLSSDSEYKSTRLDVKCSENVCQGKVGFKSGTR